MFKYLIITLILLQNFLFADISYKVYEKEIANDFNETYVNIEGFSKDIKLLIGVGIPRVESIQSLSENIKLLHCFGGAVGTSTLVEYYYTYILDFRKQKIIGLFEEYKNNSENKTEWKLDKESVEVKYFEIDTGKVESKKYRLE